MAGRVRNVVWCIALLGMTLFFVSVVRTADRPSRRMLVTARDTHGHSPAGMASASGLGADWRNGPVQFKVLKAGSDSSVDQRGWIASPLTALSIGRRQSPLS